MFFLVPVFLSAVYSVDGMLVTCVCVRACVLHSFAVLHIYIRSCDGLMQQDAQVEYYEVCIRFVANNI